MTVGDRVIINVRGVFWRHTGVITRITRRHGRRRSHVVYWIALDNPPWKRAVSEDFGFEAKELELLEKKKEHA